MDERSHPDRAGVSRVVLRRPFVAMAGVGVLGLAAWGLALAGSERGRTAQRRLAPSRAVAGGCPTPAATVRADRALTAAQARWRLESRGLTIHADLRQIAGDRRLLQALSDGDLRAALAAANRQLVRHVVQIRVVRGGRVLLDANPTSFDVAGVGEELHSGGRSLGRLEITVQDVIGFIKLVHKLDEADVLVHGSGGRVRSSLPAAVHTSLPRAGCVRVGSRTYVVSSFAETSYSGEPLTISLLTPA